MPKHLSECPVKRGYISAAIEWLQQSHANDVPEDVITMIALAKRASDARKAGEKISCRTCKHLEVQPDAAGRIIARKGKTYKCSARVFDPIVPDSVANSVRWMWPPSRAYMTAEDGENCPAYEKRKK